MDCRREYGVFLHCVGNRANDEICVASTVTLAVAENGLFFYPTVSAWGGSNVVPTIDGKKTAWSIYKSFTKLPDFDWFFFFPFPPYPHVDSTFSRVLWRPTQFHAHKHCPRPARSRRRRRRRFNGIVSGVFRDLTPWVHTICRPQNLI